MAVVPILIPGNAPGSGMPSGQVVVTPPVTTVPVVCLPGVPNPPTCPPSATVVVTLRNKGDKGDQGDFGTALTAVDQESLPLAGQFIGQFCRVGTVAPYSWYRWSGDQWEQLVDFDHTHPEYALVADIPTEPSDIGAQPAGTYIEEGDPRLSDARDPNAHTHSVNDITDFPAPPVLGTSAALDVGTTTGTVAAGDDSRFSDSRTPIAHASTHAAGGSDSITPSDIGMGSTADVLFKSVGLTNNSGGGRVGYYNGSQWVTYFSFLDSSVSLSHRLDLPSWKVDESNGTQCTVQAARIMLFMKSWSAKCGVYYSAENGYNPTIRVASDMTLDFVDNVTINSAAPDTTLSRASSGVLQVGVNGLRNADGSMTLTNLTASGLVSAGSLSVGGNSAGAAGLSALTASTPADLAQTHDHTTADTRWYMACYTSGGSTGSGATWGATNVVGVFARSGVNAAAGAAAAIGDTTWSWTAATGQVWVLDRPSKVLLKNVLLILTAEANAQALRFMVGASSTPTTSDVTPSGAYYGLEFYLSGTSLMAKMILSDGVNPATFSDPVLVGTNHTVWQAPFHPIGSVMLENTGTGVFNAYISEAPAVKTKGTKPLPTIPTITMSGVLPVGAAWRHPTVQAVNHSTTAPSTYCYISANNCHIWAAEA